MNTGVQRSGATPFGANTTTSPAGAAALGKAQQRKDMTAIAVAHHVPYVAQAASSHWQDLSEKVERAAHADGPAFLNVLTNCPVGWGHEPRHAIEILNAAVDSCYWPLYEVVDGRYRLTYEPGDDRAGRGVAAAAEALRASLHATAAPVLAEIQRQVDADWARTRRAVRVVTSFDALPPREMARKAEEVGCAKAGMSAANTFALAVLAGAFIAMGAIFATTVTAGGASLPYGVSRLLGGLAFSLGLILVVVAGAELFTGNNLIVMAWASRKVSTARLLRNWAIVYAGNFVGAIATAGHPLRRQAVHVRQGRGRRAGAARSRPRRRVSASSRRSRSARSATRSSASRSG